MALFKDLACDLVTDLATAQDTNLVDMLPTVAMSTA